MQTTGIVIKKQPTNEFDQLITFFSREAGRLTAVAKSSLKPSSIQAMHLDLFNIVECDLVEGRGWPIITGAQIYLTHNHIKADLNKTSLAFFFAEALEKLTGQGDRDEKLWDLIIKTFSELDNHMDTEGSNLMVWFRRRQYELLNVLGYRPEMGKCTFCDRSDLGRFWALAPDFHGAVCEDCFMSGRGGILIEGQAVATGSFVDGIFQSVAQSPFVSLRLIKTLSRG